MAIRESPGPRWLRRPVLLVFAIFTAIGLYNFSTFLAGVRIETERAPIGELLLNELTAAYSLLALLPLMLFFMRRYPIHRVNWYWSVPLHLLASVAVGAGHTTLMTLTRTWLYPVFDLGRYDPGRLPYRYLMEYHKQLMIYATVGAVVYAIGRMRAAREREREAGELALRAARLQTQLSEARLQALQGQLQPHFLFNTLNMISSLMYEDVRKADLMIARLSTLLRMSLDASSNPCVPLRREMEILEVYIDIMEARFGSKLRVRRELDAAVAEATVPALLLQPLVENAIRHGDPEPGRAAEITIRAFRSGSRILLEVSDNGPGIADETQGPEGLGLRSVRERLVQLFGEDGRLVLENIAPRGLRAVIELPFTPPAGEDVGAPAARVQSTVVETAP